MKKNPWKIIIGVAVVLLAASFYWSNQAGELANEGVTLSEHVKGNPQASVVLSEYADFQCPACAEFHPYVKELEEEYGDSLRIEFHHFPLISIHPYAVPAAKAAEAAGQQGQFFAMHDKLFENQDAWTNSGTPQIFFNQYAEELGLDVDMFKRHMRSSLIDQAVEDSFNAARQKGFTGTPSFELNGAKMEFQTYEDFKGQIDVAINGLPEEATSSPAVTGPNVKFGI